MAIVLGGIMHRVISDHIPQRMYTVGGTCVESRGSFILACVNDPTEYADRDFAFYGDEGLRRLFMYTITKQFTFEASHRLDHLPPDHQCARLHGHSYRVEVVIRCAMLDDRGFCQVDYGELDPFKRYLDENLDHRHLNDVLSPMRTTAENIARHLYEIAHRISPYVVAVRVSETAKTWAEYSL